MSVLTVYPALCLQKTTEVTKQERQISEGTEFDANEWPRSHVSFMNKFQLVQGHAVSHILVAKLVRVYEYYFLSAIMEI